MRAVLDPNVIISALLSPDGSPARALAYPKLHRRIRPEEAGAVVQWLARAATVSPDPDGPPRLRSPNPGDDYLIAIAAAQRAPLVSGDDHLLGLAGRLPVYPPPEFLDLLRERDER